MKSPALSWINGLHLSIWGTMGFVLVITIEDKCMDKSFPSPACRKSGQTLVRVLPKMKKM